jgi:hypothetical protein
MLFESPEEVRRPNWDDKVLSFSGDEKQILKWILTLHNNGQGVDVDPCYSIGRFWEGLPKPKQKFDLYPHLDEVRQASANNLPIDSESVSSVMFDPPFIFCSSAKTPGRIRERFTDFSSFEELKEMYASSMREFYRILKVDGILIFKCQDLMVSSTQYMTHVFVMNEAQKLGLYILDLFILTNPHVMMSSTWINGQNHARKAHSYYIVFKKHHNPKMLERTKVSS